jgi:hypothetical protein
MNSSDYLTEDREIGSQKYCLLSFLVSDKDPKHRSLVGVKFRGAYCTVEEAQEASKRLQAGDKYHHIYVGETGKWLPFSPNPDEIKDQKFQNDKLNELMEGYLENQIKKDIHFEQRKAELIKTNIEENLRIKEQNMKDRELLEDKKDDEVNDEDIDTALKEALDDASIDNEDDKEDVSIKVSVEQDTES